MFAWLTRTWRKVTGQTHLNLSPADQLARAKEIVTHLLDAWPVALQRYAIFQAMSRHDPVREGLDQTYAANVHNALQDVLVIDLIRAVGALVLDRGRTTGSVKQAVTAVRSKALISELEKDYRVIPPIHIMEPDRHTPADEVAIQKQHYDLELTDNLATLERLQAEVAAATKPILKSAVAEKLRLERNKAVAHYEVQRVGTDWKMWQLGASGLTYGDIDAYLSQCSVMIDKLNGLVLRTSYSFAESTKIFEKDAKEYLDALAIGLHQKKREKEAWLEERMKGLDPPSGDQD